MMQNGRVITKNKTSIFTLQCRLGLEANYPTSILNQSRIGEILAPLVHTLELSTGSSKGSALDMLEDDIENEYNTSCEVLSKEKTSTISPTATASIVTDPLQKEQKTKELPGIQTSSGTCDKLETDKTYKEKRRSFASSITRSLSSVTLIGSKKSSDETKRIRRRGGSISTSKLSEVVILIKFS